MANISPQFANAVSRLVFNPAFRKSADLNHWNWRQIVGVKKSDAALEYVFSAAGVGAPRVTKEGEPVYYSAMAELAKTTWTHAKYTLGVGFSKELLEDNKNYKDFISDSAAAMGEGFAYLDDYTLAQVLNRYATAGYELYDAVTLGGTHTLTQSTADTAAASVSNVGTTASINFDTIWLAVAYFMYQLYAQDGLPMTRDPKYLIYHPINEKVVRKVVEATGEPDTAELHNPQTLGKFGLIPVPCRFLTTTTNWFLGTTKIAEDFRMYDRIAKEIKSEADFDRDILKFKARRRFSAGFADWPEIYCNAGK